MGRAPFSATSLFRWSSGGTCRSAGPLDKVIDWKRSELIGDFEHVSYSCAFALFLVGCSSEK